MKTKTIITSLVCVALLLAACEVNDPIYNTPHPGKGTVILSADWSARGEATDIPAAYTAEAENAATLLTSTVPTPLNGAFPPGDMEVLAYNLPTGISLNGGIATINSTTSATTGGTTSAATSTPPSALLIPDAGILFSGTVTVHVVADDTVRTTVALHQRMRRVNFTLTIPKGDPERITAIEARLDGVAASIDLRTGETTGDAASVALPFIRKGNQLTAEAWIAGIPAPAGQNIGQQTGQNTGQNAAAPPAQQIVTTLTFTDGNRIETTADLSDLFRNFNADKLTPFHIAGSLYAPVGMEPGGTIIDWTAANGGDVDANL